MVEQLDMTRRVFRPHCGRVIRGDCAKLETGCHDDRRRRTAMKEAMHTLRVSRPRALLSTWKRSLSNAAPFGFFVSECL